MTYSTLTNWIAYFLFLILFASCQSNDDQATISFSTAPNYFPNTHNQPVLIPVGNRSVRALLSKPEGGSMDIVLVLHGGSIDYQASVQSTVTQATQWDKGNNFLTRGMAILALEYTEFDGPADDVGVTKGIMEMEEVLAAIDFLDTNPFSAYGFDINKMYAYGHSRGGGNALLAAINSDKLSAVASSAAPLNWKAIRDSIASGFLTPTQTQEDNFYATTDFWNTDTSLWTTYSPSLNLPDYQCPFMVIGGLVDSASFVDMVIDMQARYDACTNCNEESSFIIHPRGHSNWASQAILDSIYNFFSQF